MHLLKHGFSNKYFAKFSALKSCYLSQIKLKACPVRWIRKGNPGHGHKQRRNMAVVLGGKRPTCEEQDDVHRVKKMSSIPKTERI